MAFYPVNVLDNQIKAMPTVKAISNTPIATFDTDIADRLVNLQVAVTATQSGSGTPSPSNPLPITGFSACNLLHYNENLFISTNNLTKDGITTSFNSSTGLISIENNSRTTNYSVGSQRTLVISGLDTSHTYKYVFYPNVAGVVLADVNTVPLNDTFTGVASCDLRITNQYDFVNDHPIGDITTVRLFIFDMTDGFCTTTTIPFGQTVYGGVLDVLSGKLTITHKYRNLGDSNWIEATTSGSNKRFSTTIGDFKRPPNISTKGNIISNRLVAITGVQSYSGTVTGIALSHNSSEVFVSGNEFQSYTTTTFKTLMEDYDVVYELATPTVVQLTSEEVQAIVGTNNIYADCGNITDLEYKITVGLAIQ